jgi:hypothetical protein
MNKREERRDKRRRRELSLSYKERNKKPKENGPTSLFHHLTFLV